MQWTSRQQAVLRAHANEGAVGVRDALLEVCGVSRSVKSIVNYASREGISLRKVRICSLCGQVAPKVDSKTGFCRPCATRIRAQHLREKAQDMRTEAQEYARRNAAAEAEYNAARQVKKRAKILGINNGNSQVGGEK